MKRRIAWILAAVVVAASAATSGTLPAKAEVNPYITEGVHRVNGRDWRTACEPYSQTTRCRTEIRATQVTEVDGRFVVQTGWYFNNLTYLPAERSLWRNNPLGVTGTFAGADGRKWSTSCDTAVTGRNGCRSYVEARVIEPYQVSGTWRYRWVTKSVFNNIVQFTVPGPPVNPGPSTATVAMPDAKLRECINVTLRKPITSAIPLSVAQSITEIDCSEGRVSDLTGLEKFENLEFLILHFNQISNLKPLSNLENLGVLGLYNNDISDVSPLATLPNLFALELGDNRISNISSLKSLTGLEELGIGTNRVKNLASLATLKNLSYLDVNYNEISTVAPLASLTRLEVLSMSGNSISDITRLSGLKRLAMLDATENGIANIAALSGMTRMEVLFLDSNAIADVAPLQRMAVLTMLSVADNAVKDVAPLASLTKLEQLMLSSNSIRIVAPLATLPELQELYLWDNPVTDRESLDPLIARGCEVYFDEPVWDDMFGDADMLTWTESLELAGVTTSF